MKKWKWVVVQVVVLTAVAAGFAEKTAPGGAFKLDEIVVTATRGERKIRDVTSAISVIDEADIEASNADYVMDMIGFLPGVYIRRDAVYGRQFVEIRGLGGNMQRITTLVDGRPEKMSLFGCTIAQTLPLANVERIEVVRGPESTLYGTDAMGGVINIITKKARQQGFEQSALLSYGSYDSLHGMLRHGGKIDNFDYYAVYDRKQSDGHRDNSAYQADFFSLRSGYSFNEDWRLDLSGQYFQDDGEDPGPVTNPYVNNDKRVYKRGMVGADLSGGWNSSELKLSFYNNWGDHDFDMPSIDDYWHSKDMTMGASAQYMLEIFETDDWSDVLTAGYEYQYQWAEPQDDWIAWARENMPARFMNFGDYNLHNHDVFVFNEITKGIWVNTLGIRGHWDDESEQWEAIPQAGLLCRIAEYTTARVKVGKGFRRPRFSELHLFPVHNENLDAEKVISYEAALTHSFTPWLSAFINPFYMDVKNIIQQESNENPPPAFVNKNSGDFAVKGVETGLEIKPGDNLSLSVNYTYTDIEDGPENNKNINREGKPEHTVNAKAGYGIGKFSIFAEAEYVAGLYDSNLLAGGNIEKVSDFFVVDLKCAYKLNKNMSIFAGIENLFDKDYEQIPGYPMPGANVHAGFKAEL